MSLFKVLRGIENKTQSSVYLTGEYVYKFLTKGEKYKINDVVIIGTTLQVIKYLNRSGKYSKINEIYKYNNTKINITIINPIKNKTDNKLLKINSKGRYFTIYSLYLSIKNMKKSNIKDFVGGQEDINKKRIRIIGSITKKLKTNQLLLIEAITISININYSLDDKITSIQRKVNSNELIKKNINQLKRCLIAIITSAEPSKYFKLLKKLKLLKMILPELSECINLEQNIQYHKYDVFTHCIYTCDNIENDVVLRLAALFHDIGKTQTIKKIDNKVTFYKHEVDSANIAKQRLKFLEFDKEIISKVYLLVRLHMYHYTKKYTDAGIKRFIKKSKIVKEDIKNISNFSLFKLRIADRLSNGMMKVPITEIQKDFEKRIVQVYNEINKLKFKDLDITTDKLCKCFNTLFHKSIIKDIFKFLLEKIKKNPEQNKEKTLIKLTVDYLYSIDYWKENKIISNNINIERKEKKK